jgi:hypothetical protein
MTKSTVKIYDCQTNETIERDMTPEELAQVKKDEELDAARLAKQQEIALEKAALLERLGISEFEAKLLLS